jgi:thiol-disulfide isomerase/thioredoxin
MKSKIRKKFLVIFLALLFFVSLGSGCSQSSTQPAAPQSTSPENIAPNIESSPATQETGNKAPDFEATTMSGEKISLSALKGKPVILNFWATWCPPCKEEIPELNSFYQKYKDRVIMLGIEIGEPKEEVEQFLKNQSILYPIVLDSEQKSSISELYRISLVPTTFIVDENGKILNVILGSTTFEVLSSFFPNE